MRMRLEFIVVTIFFIFLFVSYLVAFYFLGPLHKPDGQETYAAWVQGAFTLLAVAAAVLIAQYQVFSVEGHERRAKLTAQKQMFSTVITLGERLLMALDGVEKFLHGSGDVSSYILVGPGKFSVHHRLLDALLNVLEKLPLEKLGDGRAIDHAILLGFEVRELEKIDISGPGKLNPIPQIRTAVVNHLQALRALSADQTGSH